MSSPPATKRPSSPSRRATTPARALGAGHDVSIAATAGDPTGDVVDIGGGRYERTFAAHAPRGTTALVTATVDGVTLAAHPSIHIVNARAEVGGAFAAGGGCSMSPASPAPLLAFAGLFAIGAFAAIRRKSRRAAHAVRSMCDAGNPLRRPGAQFRSRLARPPDPRL